MMPRQQRILPWQQIILPRQQKPLGCRVDKKTSRQKQTTTPYNNQPQIGREEDAAQRQQQKQNKISGHSKQQEKRKKKKEKQHNNNDAAYLVPGRPYQIAVDLGPLSCDLEGKKKKRKNVYRDVVVFTTVTYKKYFW